jgi:hypothetical protein
MTKRSTFPLINFRSREPGSLVSSSKPAHSVKLTAYSRMHQREPSRCAYIYRCKDCEGSMDVTVDLKRKEAQRIIAVLHELPDRRGRGRTKRLTQTDHRATPCIGYLFAANPTGIAPANENPTGQGRPRQSHEE